MADSSPKKRAALFREALVFQVKLVADGIRDVVLVPLSFFAALVGLVRGGDEPEREFRQVIELGRQTERWINLFGNHETAAAGHGGSLDALLDRAEEVVREQTREGRMSEATSRAIHRALDAAQRNARGQDTLESGPAGGDEPPDGPGQ